MNSIVNYKLQVIMNVEPPVETNTTVVQDVDSDKSGTCEGVVAI